MATASGDEERSKRPVRVPRAGRLARAVRARSDVIARRAVSAGPVPRAVRAVRAATTGRASEAGMATAEYAIATVAAVGFAGLLMVVLRSGEVKELLLGIIRGALSV